MDKIKVLYVINGAVKQDIFTGTEVSIQRNGPALDIDFPNADGMYLARFSKKVSGQEANLSWVSYNQAAWVTKAKVDSDTPAETS